MSTKEEKFYTFLAKKGTICNNCGRNILVGTAVEGHPDQTCKTGWKIRCAGGCVKLAPSVHTVTKSEDSDLSDSDLEEEVFTEEKDEYIVGSPDKKSALQHAMELVNKLDGDLSFSESESGAEEEEDDDDDVLVVDSEEEEYDDDDDDEEEDLHIGQLFCCYCDEWFSKDSFSAAQKKVSDEEGGRFCLRHTSTSAFGSTYAKGARAIGVRMGVSPGLKSPTKAVPYDAPDISAERRAISAAKRAVRHIEERDDDYYEEDEDGDDMFERHVTTPRGGKRAVKSSSSARKGRKVRRIASSDDEEEEVEEDEVVVNNRKKRKVVRDEEEEEEEEEGYWKEVDEEEEEECWSDEEPLPRRTSSEKSKVNTRSSSRGDSEDANTSSSSSSSSAVKPDVLINSTTSANNSDNNTRTDGSNVVKRQRVINLCEEGEETEEVFEVAVEVIHLAVSPPETRAGPAVTSNSGSTSSNAVRSPIRRGRLVVLDDEDEF